MLQEIGSSSWGIVGSLVSNKVEKQMFLVVKRCSRYPIVLRRKSVRMGKVFLNRLNLWFVK